MANSVPPRRPFIERPSTAILFIVAVFVGGLLVGAIIAKLRPPRQVNLPPTTLAVPTPPTTRQAPLAAGDRIKVVMTDPHNPAQSNTKFFDIGDDGILKIRILGTLDVRGRTPFEIEQAIAQGYRQQHMINDLKVEVTREPPAK
jgi:protein involved in polysaccharide export with SLBB domain